MKKCLTDEFKNAYPGDDIIQFPPDYLEMYADLCKRVKSEVTYECFSIDTYYRFS